MKRIFITISLALGVIAVLCGVIFYNLGSRIALSTDEFVAPPDATTEEILEALYEQGYIGNPISHLFLKTYISLKGPIEQGKYIFTRGMSLLDMYRALANPSMSYVRIAEGLRKEQIADVLGERFGWSDDEKHQFISSMYYKVRVTEGHYFPDTYLLPREARPEDVKNAMARAFDKKIIERYNDPSKSVINLETALTIASLIQREAAGKHDMKLISGIIWNRIFLGMPLQIDATLQYAKGTKSTGWWPLVVPDDKYIDSPFNTYSIPGLPPYPISNPGEAAIEAAYHPANTRCLYYFHDTKRGFHCTETYAAHKALLQKYY